MNSNSILNSSLLDIIFDNRNKEYGAYTLRKNYDKRLLNALLSVFTVVAAFTFWQLFNDKSTSPKFVQRKMIEGTIISSPPAIQKPVQPKRNFQPAVKQAKGVINRPVIVKDKAADTSNTLPIVNFNAPGNVANNQAEPVSDASSGSNVTGSEKKDSVKTTPVFVDRNIPVKPEVLPQFPGGMNEFIKFLKRNLQTPRDMEQDESVDVKVKFIVNYGGELLGFTITQTGGQIFDNEVIRVLKKMPKWIPGKSNGENVSAYFVVPVKFTVSE